jgi:hypothetical protein
MGFDVCGIIAMGNGGDSVMDNGVAAQLEWVMVVATRGDATISRVKIEGGTIRGNVTTS